MYMESGPVIETPLSGAQCIHDMLLQSWGGKIRVFPAVPSQWKDVQFKDLRTEGAFLVSAVRKGGKTSFIRIKSLAGEPCILRTDMANPVVKAGNATLTLQKEGEYLLDLKKGESVILTAAGGEYSRYKSCRRRRRKLFRTEVEGRLWRNKKQSVNKPPQIPVKTAWVYVFNVIPGCFYLPVPYFFYKNIRKLDRTKSQINDTVELQHTLKSD